MTPIEQDDGSVRGFLFGIPVIATPVTKSTYAVIKNGKVIRTAKALGARNAKKALKPKKGENLYIKVGR